MVATSQKPREGMALLGDPDGGAAAEPDIKQGCICTATAAERHVGSKAKPAKIGHLEPQRISTGERSYRSVRSSSGLIIVGNRVSCDKRNALVSVGSKNAAQPVAARDGVIVDEGDDIKAAFADASVACAAQAECGLNTIAGTSFKRDSSSFGIAG